MKNFVITIGREFASGGKEVGKRVAKELGVDFYDASLLRERAYLTFLTKNPQKVFCSPL